MHYYKLSLQLQSFGLVYAALVSAVNNPNRDSSLNFRPDNVTFNGLYDWVGS